MSPRGLLVADPSNSALHYLRNYFDRILQLAERAKTESRYGPRLSVFDPSRMELSVTGELSPARSNTVCWLAPKELSEEKSYRSCPEVKSTQFLSSNMKKKHDEDGGRR